MSITNDMSSLDGLAHLDTRKGDGSLIKPTFSLELSVSPSSNGEGFAVDVPHVGERPVIPSMRTAGGLVQKLLDQVTLNDNPPSNEASFASGNQVLPRVEEYSRQCHVQPLSEIGSNTVLSETTTSNTPKEASTMNPSYGKQSHVAQQGHAALANLCAHTLESIGQAAVATTPTQDEDIVELTNARVQPAMIGKANSSRFSMKKLWNKNPSRTFVQVESTSSLDESEPQPSSPPPRQTRLRMFGSEYARFLSTTPLAPSDVTKGPKRQLHRPASLRRKALKSSIQNLEDAEKSVLTGPITDVIVTQGDEVPPKGYYRLSQSASGGSFSLRDRKSALHICVKKETNWDRAAQRPCVTALTIIFPERKEFVPPGFSVVRKQKSKTGSTTEKPPANLNYGGGEVVFLCYRRSREGNPVTGIVPLYPSRKETIPEGYTVLERTPKNFVASFSVSSTPVFLAYRQRLANLELLRPSPLVMSVHMQGPSARRLTAYYCTGGTVVESRVGRFHIFDRSTHSLVSPSSINNRLSLIEASRQKAQDQVAGGDDGVGEKYSYSASGSESVRSIPSSDVLNSSLLLAQGLGTPGSRSTMSESDRHSSIADFESFASSSDHNRSVNSSYSSSRYGDDGENLGGTGCQWRNVGLCTVDNKDLERCISAMDFIPAVSSGFNANDPNGVKSFQTRVAVLTPVLTVCYTRHGGSALVAVEGLSKLLRQDFFADDVNMSQLSSIQTTLLDVAVQVVCDVATMGSQETHLYACVDFVEQAVKYGCGYLSTRSIGYVLRFYLFVFYFGMSYPVGNWGILRASDRYILEDPRTVSAENKILPGGAPQSAILSLKDLFVFLVARLGSLVYLDECVAKRETAFVRKNEFGPLQIFGLIDKMVNEVVDTSVYRVNIANLTQLAMHQIMRSGGSELFWYEMINSCGAGLFGNDKVLREETRHLYALCFALMANCVKTATSKIRKNKNSDSIPRDVASKLMSLEMMKFFLETWERGPARQQVQGSTSLATFAFCVRRLVVPCLLKNTADSLDDPRVFRRVIQLVGTLWTSSFYRKHMKLEIGVMFDHFVLRLLGLGPQILFKTSDDHDMTYLFAQQLELMKELKTWFSGDSNGLLELFLNFDTDYGNQQIAGGKELLSDIQWRICQQLCSSLCNVAEKSTEFLGEQIRESQSTVPVDNLTKEQNQGYEGVSTTTLARESARRLRQGALDASSQIVQQLAQIAASPEGSQFQAILDAWANNDTIDVERLNLGHIKRRIKETSDFPAESRDDADSSPESRTQTNSVLNYWQRLSSIKQRLADSKSKKENTVQGDRSVATVYSECEETSAERRRALNVAFDIANEKGLNKAIDYLIACNVLTASSKDIASFLRIHRGELSSSTLGKYLGEGGADRAQTEYWNLIRFNFIRAISFVGMSVEEGLRHLLTQGGFHLPGEAQQIDRIISTFSRCYWEDNAGDPTHCPFKSQDTVFLLSFAIIMLNTDLHKFNSGAIANKKAPKKMSKIEFINNLQGVGNGSEIDSDYLADVYDKIETEPILIREEDEAEDDECTVTSENVQTCIAKLVDNAKSVDSLLNGLSTQEYRYVSLKEYVSELNGKRELLAKNLAKKFVEQVWHRIHGLMNSALEVAHLDPKGMDSCIHLLRYALFLTIISDMKVEQTAFLDQLGRFHLFNSWRQGNSEDLPSDDQESYKNEEWYSRMEFLARTPSNEGKLESLLILDDVIRTLDFSLPSDAEGRKAFRNAVRQLENAEFLLNDPNRSFVRQGVMSKRANRTGRCVDYRFFLFSDVLIYAKKIPGSDKFRIHEELPLILMKVVDWFPPEQKKESKLGIQIYHPRKKILVLCTSTEERKSWVTAIRESIDKELARKVAIEGARKAAANVPTGANY
ncbi:MAG: hypothetical protein SGILL_000556 [Bacillariaceae sp.]